jgi:Stage II sporulation protein M
VRDSATAEQPVTRYAFVYGVRRTHQTLSEWQQNPWPALRRWFTGSFLAAVALLGATWLFAALSHANGYHVQTIAPPFRVGDLGNVGMILFKNLGVLALHAMACVAGFIAGSSLPLQAQEHRGLARAVHEHGGRIAIVFVVIATTFSLSTQAIVLGGETAAVAARLHTSPGALLVVLLPHALIELTALFLPLAAWIIASHRRDWDQLLAATIVTVAIALPMLVLAALIEVYVSPHLMATLVR